MCALIQIKRRDSDWRAKVQKIGLKASQLQPCLYPVVFVVCVCVCVCVLLICIYSYIYICILTIQTLLWRERERKRVGGFEEGFVLQQKKHAGKYSLLTSRRRADQNVGMSMNVFVFMRVYVSPSLSLFQFQWWCKIAIFLEPCICAVFMTPFL